MANVVITLKIMPDSPESDLNKIKAEAEKEIKLFAGEGEIKAEEKPVAFGLKSLNIMFVMPEEKGSTEALEKKINDLAEVNSVECIDVRRAIG